MKSTKNKRRRRRGKKHGWRGCIGITISPAQKGKVMRITGIHTVSDTRNGVICVSWWPQAY